MSFSDQDLQKGISGVLRYSVLTVLIIGSIGGLLYLIQHGHETVDYSVFTEKDTSVMEVVRQIGAGIKALDAAAIIFLAVLILFLTPLVRLLLSLVSFILEKDVMYVIITLIVLAIISTSVYLGVAH